MDIFEYRVALATDELKANYQELCKGRLKLIVHILEDLKQFYWNLNFKFLTHHACI